MIKIKYLSHFPHHARILSEIWVESIGKNLFSDVTAEMKEAEINQTLNEAKLPLSFVALDNDKPVGMGTLSMDGRIEGVDYSPFLSLFVRDDYKSRGIAKLLIRSVKSKAFKMGFKKLYVVIFTKDLVPKYESAGWRKIGTGKAGKLSGDIMEMDLTFRDLL